ncbi:MAG: Polyphosphate kinase [Myxococcales bacterium]|nr:Polyphosphate kinase [Myxococcales bacterium]
MANNLDLLFPGMEIEACSSFRVTRNAIAGRDEEEADDLLEMIEIELRKRKFAPVVRLQVDTIMHAQLRGRLASELGLDEGVDVFEAQGMLGQRDLMEIATLDIPDLRDPPHAPAQPIDFITEGNLFHAIRDAKQMLVHQTSRNRVPTGVDQARSTRRERSTGDSRQRLVG